MVVQRFKAQLFAASVVIEITSDRYGNRLNQCYSAKPGKHGPIGPKGTLYSGSLEPQNSKEIEPNDFGTN